MKRTALYKKLWSIIVLGLLLGGASPFAQAYDFEVTSRTEGYGYQLRRYQANGIAVLNRRRITQYLGLRVFNLLDPGEDAYSPKHKDRPPALLTWESLLRFHSDFSAYSEASPAIAELTNNELEILFGSLEGRNFFGWIDFSLGRLLDEENQDYLVYDGLRVRANTPLHLYFETSVGNQLDAGRPFASIVVAPEVEISDPAQSAWRPTLGLATGSDDWTWAGFRVAYRGIAARALPLAAPVGSSADSSTQQWHISEEALFLSLRSLVPKTLTQPLASLRYNILLARLDEVNLRLVQPLGSRQRIEAEYGHLRPHFDGDSIFNLFASEPYQEAAGSYQVYASSTLLLYGRAGYRWFSDEDTVAVTKGALSAQVGTQWQTTRTVVGLSAYFLDGEDDRSLGADLAASFALRSHLSCSGRLTGLYLDQNRSDARYQPITMLGIESGVTWGLAPGVKLHFLLEDNLSRIDASALRLLAVLDMEFAP